jgi:hypothetical protein
VSSGHKRIAIAQVERRRCAIPERFQFAPGRIEQNPMRAVSKRQAFECYWMNCSRISDFAVGRIGELADH